MNKLLAFMLFMSQVMISIGSACAGDTYKIYIDADFSNHPESSVSIERGLTVALDSFGFELLGKPVKIVRKDHRGNSARSERHIKQYLNDPDALLMMSGIHSPPLLAHREKINQEGVLFLVPWAAAGPITRFPSPNNWIFRLSVDDSKAGQVIARYAVQEKKYKRPFLILENTGWGKSNAKTMSKALTSLGIENSRIGWFDWNLKQAGAMSLIDQALDANADVIFLVANAIEGEVIVNSLASVADQNQLPVMSHWGIIGGDFQHKVKHHDREKVSLNFIQTRFSFVNREMDQFEKRVFENTQSLFPDVETPLDILAPNGFIHAYDLGLLLRQAASQTMVGQTIKATRANLREALENIEHPVRGLVKTYQRPFSMFSESNPDAHEALGIGDFVMASFGEDNEIILDGWRFR